MKVKDLIELLESYDEDAEVMMLDSDCCPVLMPVDDVEQLEGDYIKIV